MSDSKKNTWLWVGAGALAVYGVYNYITNNAWTILRNYIKISGFRLMSIYKDSINTQVLLTVENPLPTTLFCDGFLIDVYFNEVPISKISQPVNQYLYAKKFTNIVLNVSISQQQLGDSVWQHIQAGGTINNWKVSIRGLIRVNGYDIDFDTFVVMDDINDAFGINGLGYINSEAQAIQFAKRTAKKSEYVPYTQMSVYENRMLDMLSRSGGDPVNAGELYYFYNKRDKENYLRNKINSASKDLRFLNEPLLTRNLTEQENRANSDYIRREENEFYKNYKEVRTTLKDIQHLITFISPVQKDKNGVYWFNIELSHPQIINGGTRVMIATKKRINDQNKMSVCANEEFNVILKR